jgi:hypothetical protein
MARTTSVLQSGQWQPPASGRPQPPHQQADCETSRRHVRSVRCPSQATRSNSLHRDVRRCITREEAPNQPKTNASQAPTIPHIAKSLDRLRNQIPPKTVPAAAPTPRAEVQSTSPPRLSASTIGSISTVGPRARRYVNHNSDKSQGLCETLAVENTAQVVITPYGASGAMNVAKMVAYRGRIRIDMSRFISRRSVVPKAVAGDCALLADLRPGRSRSVRTMTCRHARGGTLLVTLAVVKSWRRVQLAQCKANPPLTSKGDTAAKPARTSASRCASTDI